MRVLALGVVVALVALAPQARAQGALDDYELGEQLLTDARFPKPKDRQVYAVEGHPELSISLLGPEHPTKAELDAELAALRQRKADLDRLADAGVPTLRVLDVGVIDGRPAYLHRRMATGTAEPNWMTERGPILDETTKAAIDAAKAKLAKTGTGVKEAELWFDEKGRVFIDAPKGVVTPSESGPWASFYSRQTAGALDSVKGLADISISYRKNVLLRGLPEFQDPSLARFFEFGTVDLLENDVKGEQQLRTALAKYLSSGETTDFAKTLGVSIAKGDQGLFFEHEDGVFRPKPGDLTVPIGKRSLPELAFDLVREGARRALDGLGSAESALLADIHAAEFWRAKKVPAKVASDDHPASTAYDRGFERASSTAGATGALEERIRDASSPETSERAP